MNAPDISETLVIGMLSGTSRDGVDAVLVNIRADRMDVLHAMCTPYPAAIRLMLDQLAASGQPPTDAVAGLLDDSLGRLFARSAQDLVREAGMEMRDISVIGSHGQTVWHAPEGSDGVSIQLGKPELIARGTATTVVADFRSTDIRAGGQGAPLAPLLHREIFYSADENRAVLNLGGIANLTLLPATGEVSGFDCGPGNCLMDAWAKQHLQKSFDDRGIWASRGKVEEKVLECMLSDPYFKRPPPKSTGLEYFNLGWLDSILAGFGPAITDVQATLVELTTRSIATSLSGSGLPDRMLVCGGGVHNDYLMRSLGNAMPDIIIESTAYYGVDPDWVEGLLFAWLARERLNQRLHDTTPITGARHAVMLGEVFTAGVTQPGSE